MRTKALQTGLTVVTVMRPFKTSVPNQRNLLHLLESFVIALLQNFEHQVVQDPCDVVLRELWNLKWRLGAFLTSLSKDPHLHLAHALLPTPVHVENHQYVARGPTARAYRTLEPGKGLLLVLQPAWLQDVGKKDLVRREGPFVPWFHLLH